MSANKDRYRRTRPRGDDPAARAEFRVPRATLARLLLIALAAPLLFAAGRLSLDLWYDEVYTLLAFASQPVSGIVTDYSAPNNHIFFTLLVHPLFLVTDEPLALRVFAFLITAATLVATFLLAYRLAGATAAVVAVLALGLNVMFVTHAMQLRGYGLSMLLVVLLTLAATWRDSAPRQILVALLGALFLYTIPTNLFFVVPLAAWDIGRRWRSDATSARRLLALAPWAAAGLIGLALYWPVLDQLRSHQPSNRATIASWSGLTGDVAWAAGHDCWPLLLIALIGFVRARRQWREWTPATALAVAMLVGPLLLTLLAGTTPFARNFCTLLPFLAILIGLGASLLVKNVGWIWLARLARPTQALVAAGVVAVVLIPALLLYPARLRAARQAGPVQDGYYNYYAADFAPSCVARSLAEAIKPGDSYGVYYAKAQHFNLVYYLARAGFPIPPVSAEHSARPDVYVVLPEGGSLTEVAGDTGLAVNSPASFDVVHACPYYRVLRLRRAR